MHDEISRLLELNQERARAEARPALSALRETKEKASTAVQVTPSAAPKAKKTARKKKDEASLSLFGAVEGKEKS